jgi:hypothetical protein
VNKEEYRAGLWKKEAKSGIKYCTGKIKIGDREFQLTLFNNDKKGNEKAPDFNLIVRDGVISQEKQENTLNEPKNSVKKDNTNEFKEFGNQFYVDEISLDDFISDEGIPF